MLKNYIVNGICRQYEEGTEPEGAVAVEPVIKAKEPEVKAVTTEKKAAKTTNKSRGAKTK